MSGVTLLWSCAAGHPSADISTWGFFSCFLSVHRGSGFLAVCSPRQPKRPTTRYTGVTNSYLYHHRTNTNVIFFFRLYRQITRQRNHVFRRQRDFPPYPRRVRVKQRNERNLHHVTRYHIRNGTTRPNPKMARDNRHIRRLKRTNTTTRNIFRPIIRSLKGTPRYNGEFQSYANHPRRDRLAPTHDNVVHVRSISFHFFVRFRYFFQRVQDRHVYTLLYPRNTRHTNANGLYITTFNGNLPITHPRTKRQR